MKVLVEPPPLVGDASPGVLLAADEADEEADGVVTGCVVTAETVGVGVGKGPSADAGALIGLHAVATQSVMPIPSRTAAGRRGRGGCDGRAVARRGRANVALGKDRGMSSPLSCLRNREVARVGPPAVSTLVTTFRHSISRCPSCDHLELM